MTAPTPLLRELTGTRADGIWSAPGRVNLIGEHTDYNDGFVLPFAIQHRTHVALGARDDGAHPRGRRRSTTDAVEVAARRARRAVPRAPRRRAPSGRATRSASRGRCCTRPAGTPASVTGVDLAFTSDVPVGAGLSSSAAIEGAAASALNDTWGLGLDRVALAKVGRTAENEAVGAPTGIMDQMASMLGRADAAIFLDCRSLEATVVDLGFAAAGLELLVIDTGVKHSHATGGYGERRASCERGAAIMGVPALRDVSVDDLPRAAELMDDVTFRRVRHIVTENQRVLDTVARAARAAARARSATSSSPRTRRCATTSRSRSPELDTAVEAALAAGAVGARMTGGGFGGAAIALVAHDRVEQVKDAVDRRVRGIRVRRPHDLHRGPVRRRAARLVTAPSRDRRNPWRGRMPRA